MRRNPVVMIGLLLALGACKRGPEKVPEGAQGQGDETKEVACGPNVCRDGQVCCNPSCGLCAPPDGMCTQQFCDAPHDMTDGAVEALPAAPITCDNVRCAAGTQCEMVQVQCIKAPCDPVPECRPKAEEEK